jgi:hypothetical protein
MTGRHKESSKFKLKVQNKSQKDTSNGFELIIKNWDLFGIWYFDFEL